MKISTKEKKQMIEKKNELVKKEYNKNKNASIFGVY